MKASELIKEFLANKSINQNSRFAYDQALRKFFLWTHTHGKDPDDLKSADFINYKDYLKEANISASTMRNYFRIVRLFYRKMDEMGILDDITKGTRPPKYDNSFKKYPLSREQVRELLESIDRSDEIGLRDYAIIMLMICNGLRRAEANNINLSDITIKNGKHCIFIKGKGRDDKDQVIYITDPVRQAINDYLQLRNCWDDNQPLFTSAGGRSKYRRLKANSMTDVIKERLKAIGLNSKFYTCHSLRHTAACLLIDAGYDLHQVQLFLRHKSPLTTQLYTRVIDEKIKAENKASETIINIILNNPKKPLSE